jgi:hypothetical protein
MNSEFSALSSGAHCLDCACSLECRAFGEWSLNQCPRCGGFWMNGEALRQILLSLHLRRLDSDQAVREVGALLLRAVSGRAGGPVNTRPVVLPALGSHSPDPAKGDRL